MDHRELEWQFDAVDIRPVERWLSARVEGEQPAAVAVGTRVLVDLYLDTDDRRLHRAGCSLRIRTKRGQAEATLKSLEGPEEGLRRRREITEPVRAADPRAVIEATGPVGDRVRAVVGGHPLKPMFEVRTRRRTYQLLLDGIPAAELALDWTTIPVDGGEPARLRRIEVELMGETDPALEAFVRSMREECGLQPAGVSKYEAGVLATGIRPAERIDLGPTDVDASKSLGEVAAAVLRAHLAAFLDNEPGTRLGDDPEDLHDMRVASRRLRAAMSLFADVLPVRTGRLRDEIGWIAEALGAVRDLDVQLEQSAEWEARASEAERPSLKSLGALLEDQRGEARSLLLEALDSRRFQRLTTAMIGLARSAPLRRSVRSRTPILAAAPDLIRKRYRTVRKSGDRLGRDSAPAEYHRLRIRCKRLRYALEFLSKVYPEHTGAPIRRLVVLQDLLGLHQDAQVAVARLLELVEQHGSSLPPETIFAMGRIAERHELRAQELRQRFPKAYRKVRGSPWKALRRAMRLGQQSIEATPHAVATPADAPTSQLAMVAPA